MQSAQRLFEQGRTREQLAKQFKVSTSTIDDWRKKVTAGKSMANNTATRTATHKVARRVVRAKSTTAIVATNQENIRLAALVGKLFLALTERGGGTVHLG